MLTTKDDYSYIQVFIDFLKQIIDMIVKLFNSMGGSAEEEPKEETPEP